MLAIYFAFLLIGVMGLGSSMIFGGDDADFDGDLSDGLDSGDVFDDSPKVFSMRVIFSFLLAFSIGGGSMYYGGNSIGGQIMVGLLTGIATGAFTWWVTKILYKMQGASNVSSEDLIGSSGDIVIGTTEAGKAKVRVSTINGPMELMCKEANDKKLKNGDLVKVSGKIGTLLIVSKQTKKK
jgi:membrane-bound ClpP family serine protease